MRFVRWRILILVAGAVLSHVAPAESALHSFSSGILGGGRFPSDNIVGGGVGVGGFDPCGAVRPGTQGLGAFGGGLAAPLPGAGALGGAGTPPSTAPPGSPKSDGGGSASLDGQTVVNQRCNTCHGSTRSPISSGAAAVARINSTSNPMPPGGGLSVAEKNAITTLYMGPPVASASR